MSGIPLSSFESCSSLSRGQWKIEESFRILKTDLEARPVYVYKDSHIQGHFAMCYVALCMLRYLQYTLSREGKEVLSTERIMACVEDPMVVVAGTYPDVAIMPTNLSEDFLSLYSHLGFRPLERAMTPTRFRSITKLDLNPQLKMMK